MKKLIFSIIAMVFAAYGAVAATPDSVRYHHHATDTAIVNRILQKTRDAKLATSADRVAFVAKQLIGTPYESATLEGDKEQLTVNLSQMDCTTFVENVMALAYTAAIDTATVDDFVARLQEIRYRDGVIDGYASRLHYVSDWIVDNASRGNFVEVTSKLPRAVQQSKALNYISKHYRSYEALQNDAAALEKIKKVEAKYNPCRYSYIPKNMAAIPMVKKSLKEGDIILITTSTDGLDVMHMGIVVMKNGAPYLLHASSNAKSVLVDLQPLAAYLSSVAKATGFRVVRM